jgi:hypothetical protein
MENIMRKLAIITAILLALVLFWVAMFATVCVPAIKPAKAAVTATGTACSAAGCAYTRNQRQTLVACDNRRDGHEFRAQGITRGGEQWTVRDGNGVNPGCGRTNPHDGGKFVSIRGGYPGHWTGWRPA